MVRTKENQQSEKRCVRGGNGEVLCCKILNGEEELYGKGTLFNHIFLEPGVSIGDHPHSGNNEIYYILKGTGLYNDNGNMVQVYPGDVTVCNDGEIHGLINNSDETIEMIALILYN